MSGFDQLVEILNGDQSSGYVRLDIAKHDPIVPDGVVRPIRAQYFETPESDVVTGEGLAEVYVRNEQGDVDSYFLGSGSERGMFQLFPLGAVEARIHENLSLQGRPLPLVEPLVFTDLARLQEEQGVNVAGLGADGLFDAQPEVMVDAPEMGAARNVDAGVVDDFTRQADPDVGGTAPAYIQRPSGDVVGSVEGRLAPELVDPQVEVVVPKAPDEAVVETEEIRPPLDIPPYDRQEDIAEWLSREHGIVNMPILMDTAPGTKEAEQQLGFSVSMVAAQIADGTIAENAQANIIKAFETYDDPKFGEHKYSAYLETLFERAGEGHDAVTDLSGELFDITSERYNILLAEPKIETAPTGGTAPMLDL